MPMDIAIVIGLTMIGVAVVGALVCKLHFDYEQERYMADKHGLVREAAEYIKF